MVNVNVISEDNFNFIMCEGHAGFAEKGKDIVCAGVSVLCMALLDMVTDYCTSYSVEISDGKFILQINECTDPNIKGAIGMFVKGIRKLEMQYPENVSFNDGYFPVWDEYTDTSEQTMNSSERKEG
ncbi:MAG: ribosomal-processing cysteine protease Prp [Clostridia bacterium]|nr:ribosomal-processing cysteine protease Prp [Clostridia bacterium]